MSVKVNLNSEIGRFGLSMRAGGGSNEKRFQGGLVFKARRLFASLNSRPRVIKKKKKVGAGKAPFAEERASFPQRRLQGLLAHTKPPPPSLGLP